MRGKKLQMDFNKTCSEEEERARKPSVTLWCEGTFILFYCGMLTDKIVDRPTLQQYHVVYVPIPANLGYGAAAFHHKTVKFQISKHRNRPDLLKTGSRF